ncbi:MAG: S8 family serine peptidase [Bacteroides sp.]
MQKRCGSGLHLFFYPVVFYHYYRSYFSAMRKSYLVGFVLFFLSLALCAQETTLQRVRIDQPMSVLLQEELAADGVELLEFLGGNEYVARVGQNALQNKVRLRNSSSSFVPFTATEKIAPSLLQKEGELIVRVFLVSESDLQSVRGSIETLGGTYLSYDELLCAVRCIIPSTCLQELARHNAVLWVHPLPRQRKIRDWVGKLLSEVPLVQHEGNASGLDLMGRGVRIGIWDETIDPHPDLVDKVSVQENAMQSTGHGTHVAGIILGAGFLQSAARGMSPQARAWSYNFKFEESQRDEWDEMQDAYQQYHFSLTNNSYGVDYTEEGCSDYEQMVYDFDAPFDLLARRYPLLTHVFAAGNERNNTTCASKFNNGYGSSPSRGKNLIYVGAVDADARMTSFSSWGPMDDGRLIPTVVAHGAKVLSTDRSSGYTHLSGTSMSCPAVTGQLALVTEYYARQNNNEIPRSDLLRALVANTAEDIAPEGPDYATGYGLVKAPNMIEVLRSQNYILDSCRGQGEQRDYEISVPDGVESVRVMLVWNDAVTLRPHAWGEKALVNDLDLVVENGNTTLLPWILDPKQPSRAAKQGEDHLNTMEQVTAASPQRTLKVSVYATALPRPSQPFALVWYFEREPQAAFLLPRAGERLGESFTVSLSGLTMPVQLRVLNQQGATLKFTTLSKPTEELQLDIKNFDTVYLEATDLHARTITSGKFACIPVPQLLRLDNAEEIPGGLKLSWRQIELPNTEFYYSICIACSADDNWQEIGRVSAKESSYEIAPTQLFGSTRVALAVRVVIGNVQGKLSDAMFTPLLPPRTNATVSTLPSLYASIQMTDAAHQPLQEGATVAVNATANLRVHVAAERQLQKLLVHGEELPFSDAGEGNYTASFQIPSRGLYRNFCFEVQTIKAASAPEQTVTLRYDSVQHLGLQVMEEGVLRKASQALRRGTTLTLLCAERGIKRAVYFTVNGERLDGTYHEKRLEAKYTLTADYAKDELQIDCFYNDLPAIPFTTEVHGTGARIEYLTNGAPLLPNGLCARGELLSVRIKPNMGVGIEKIVCNGALLKWREQGGIFIADYFVPTNSEVSSVHIAIYLSGSPTEVVDTSAGSIQVAPNPFRSLLRISCNELRNVRYALLNAQGVLVRSGLLEARETLVNTTTLPAGLYVLRLTTEEGLTKVYRIVKE